MATITHDTLDWYGWDEDGAGVHDAIGTRCDPYTNLLLKGTEYHLAPLDNTQCDEGDVCFGAFPPSRRAPLTSRSHLKLDLAGLTNSVGFTIFVPLIRVTKDRVLTRVKDWLAPRSGTRAGTSGIGGLC